MTEGVVSWLPSPGCDLLCSVRPSCVIYESETVLRRALVAFQPIPRPPSQPKTPPSLRLPTPRPTPPSQRPSPHPPHNPDSEKPQLTLLLLAPRNAKDDRGPPDEGDEAKGAGLDARGLLAPDVLAEVGAGGVRGVGEAGGGAGEGAEGGGAEHGGELMCWWRGAKEVSASGGMGVVCGLWCRSPGTGRGLGVSEPSVPFPPRAN